MPTGIAEIPVKSAATRASQAYQGRSTTFPAGKRWVSISCDLIDLAAAIAAMC